MPNKKTILYIDQDPASRLFVDRTLRYAGYHVLTAQRGLEGIDLARSEPVSLILTDIDLPDITGRELTTVLRNDRQFRDVPIVALTDLTYEEQRDLAMAAGLTGYITKPLDVEVLPERLEYYLGGGRDDIDERRLSKAQSRYSREIITNLEVRVRELEEKNQYLVRLDQLKDNFLQITAHELRTPLTLIYGYSRLLTESDSVQRATIEDTNSSSILGGLVEAVERMQTIINEITTMSRIMTDKFEIFVHPVPILELIHEVITRYENAITQRGLQLTVEEDGFPETISGDRDMLEVVIDNLLSNAIKYTPDGGSIQINADMDDTHLTMHFIDTGIGIAPEDRNMIFDRFHTANDPLQHSTSKTAFGGGGLGLGLSICKGAVQAHGGTISVRSPGRDEKSMPGSEFLVRLPLVAREDQRPFQPT